MTQLKQMTYLEVILWIQNNVSETYQDFTGDSFQKYNEETGKLQYEVSSLLEYVLKYNNAELNNASN